MIKLALRNSNKYKRNARAFSTKTFEYDLAVIGSGPGGYVAAIKAAQLGMKVACIEKSPTLGGTCLNVGCIPSKSLLNISHLYHSAKTEYNNFGIGFKSISIDMKAIQEAKLRSVRNLTSGVEYLFRKNKVKWIKGAAEFSTDHALKIHSTDGSPKDTPSEISAKNIIIATGSDSRSIPGIEIDEDTILSSTGALELSKVPQKLVVIGAGVIGLELGSVFSRLGSLVTVVEYMDRIVPGLDKELATSFTSILQKQNLKFMLNTGVSSIDKSGKNVRVITLDKNKNKKEILCDKVLIAIGRRPFVDGLNCDKINIQTERGMVKTGFPSIKNESNDFLYGYRTSVPNIYAIGDVIKGPQLAHKAEEEGIAVVESLAGKEGHVDYNAIPGVIYTNPEVAYVGKTEQQLLDMNIDYSVGKFPFIANSRARTVDSYEGFVKVLSDKQSDKILGVHMIGEQAGDLIQEAVLAIQYGGSSEDIARTCHAHPTRSEALKEAAMAAFDKPIHI